MRPIIPFIFPPYKKDDNPTYYRKPTRVTQYKYVKIPESAMPAEVKLYDQTRVRVYDIDNVHIAFIDFKHGEELPRVIECGLLTYQLVSDGYPAKYVETVPRQYKFNKLTSLLEPK